MTTSNNVRARVVSPLPDTMLAARWHAAGDIRIEQLPVPPPQRHEALVEVWWCGICGTDLEEYRHGPLTIPIDPRTGRARTLVLGHEMVGMIAVAAADGSGPAVGTVVVPDVVSGCGSCWWCSRHEEGLCRSLQVLGQTEDGGLAHYVAARADRCLPVPRGCEPRSAALAEPLAVAVRAVRKAGTLLGSRVAVLGGGTIGQLVAQVARVAGAADIVVMDPLPARVELASRLSGARGCSPDDAEELARLLPDPGLDVVLECSGAPGALAMAVNVVRAGGTVIAVGLGPGPHDVPLVQLVLGEKQVVGSAAHMYDTDVAAALELLAMGRVQVEPLISHEFALADLATRALPTLADPAVPALKILLDCQARRPNGSDRSVSLNEEQDS